MKMQYPFDTTRTTKRYGDRFPNKIIPEEPNPTKRKYITFANRLLIFKSKTDELK